MVTLDTKPVLVCVVLFADETTVAIQLVSDQLLLFLLIYLAWATVGLTFIFYS